MTKVQARTRLSPDARRAQLVGHALASFAEHGVARAPHAHVAARAGVSVSAVYSYFRTRADLVDVVLGAVETTIAAMVETALDNRLSASPALVHLARQTADMALREPDTVRVWLDWSTGVGADAWPRFLSLQRQMHALVEAVILRDDGHAFALDGASVDAAARLFVGSAHTLALMQFEEASRGELDAFIAQMVNGVLWAVRSPD